MRRFAFCISATLLWAMAAPPALAQSTNDPITVIGKPANDDIVVRVPYGDLQLTEALDRTQLHKRVKAATTRACNVIYPDPQAVPSQRRGCQILAMDAAKPQIDRAVSAALGRQTASSATIVIAFVDR
jgi:UrcA family protein